LELSPVKCDAQHFVVDAIIASSGGLWQVRAALEFFKRELKSAGPAIHDGAEQCSGNGSERLRDPRQGEI
jgi:hypothetical protein